MKSNFCEGEAVPYETNHS